jgi:hypothetical protein
MTASERKTIKAGKHERIRKLLTKIYAEQHRVNDNIAPAEAMDAPPPDIVAVPARMSRVGLTAWGFVSETLGIRQQASHFPEQVFADVRVNAGLKL